MSTVFQGGYGAGQGGYGAPQQGYQQRPPGPPPPNQLYGGQGGAPQGYGGGYGQQPQQVTAMHFAFNSFRKVTYIDCYLLQQYLLNLIVLN